MKIEIRDQKVENFSGTSSKTGKPFSMNKQEGYCHMDGQPYPQRIEITLDDKSTGFPPGMYQMEETSFYVNRFGQLSIGTLKLKRIADLPAQQKAS